MTGALGRRKPDGPKDAAGPQARHGWIAYQLGGSAHPAGRWYARWRARGWLGALSSSLLLSFRPPLSTHADTVA
jgi:hypothetical protein